jgi:hypothetical protein
VIARALGRLAGPRHATRVLGGYPQALYSSQTHFSLQRKAVGQTRPPSAVQVCEETSVQQAVLVQQITSEVESGCVGSRNGGLAVA